MRTPKVKTRPIKQRLVYVRPKRHLGSEFVWLSWTQEDRSDQKEFSMTSETVDADLTFSDKVKEIVTAFFKQNDEEIKIVWTQD